MLYQKLLLGSNPFFLSVGKTSAFETHRHPEIELIYCLNGEDKIVCENKHYTLKEGDLAVIAPMAAHEFPTDHPSGKRLTIEVGYAFLGSFFEAVSGHLSGCRLYQKKTAETDPLYREMVHLLEETAAIRADAPPFGELLLKGNLYRVGALLLQITCPKGQELPPHKNTDVEKIDRALERIYNNYYEPLSVEEISAYCGYSKSNFCKLFKAITGDTFHNTLNRHRVEIARMLLRETNETVERIAQETGFADSKSFCRVFKKIMGQNAGAYRKKAR